MKNLQKFNAYIFKNYFDEIVLALDLFVIIYPVRPEIKIMILLIKYFKKKTDS